MTQVDMPRIDEFQVLTGLIRYRRLYDTAISESGE